MKTKIMPLLLVIALLLSNMSLVFAESVNTEEITQEENQNIEKNDALSTEPEVEVGNENLDGNKEQISDTSTEPETENTPDTPDTPSISEPTTDEDKDSEVSEPTMDTEGSDKPLSPPEGTIPPDIENPSEGNPEGSEDIVIIPPPVSEEDLNKPTDTSPPDELDPGFTIPPEQEQGQGQDTPAGEEPIEPQVFYIDAALAFRSNAEGTAMTAALTYTNTSELDVVIKGVQVIPVNGWTLVGEEVDFKNQKVDQKECRLTVENQIVLNTEDGYTSLNEPLAVAANEVVSSTILLEFGPMKDGFKEGLFVFRLVVEEVLPVVEEPPVIEPPVSQPPIIEPPVIEPPVIEPPVSQPPIIDEPVIDEPTIDIPVEDEPVIDKPEVDTPDLENPTIDAPVVDEPNIDEPVIEPPIVEEPNTEGETPVDEDLGVCLPDTLPNETEGAVEPSTTGDDQAGVDQDTGQVEQPEDNTNSTDASSSEGEVGANEETV